MVLSDDDSDASFQGSKSKKQVNKRPSPASYQDDDSDTDDSLLLNNKPTFRSSSRLRDNKKPKMDTHLADALKSRSIKMETQISIHRKIQQTKQEDDLHGDDLLNSAKALKSKRDADRKEREKEKQQQVQQELQLLQQSSDGLPSTSLAPRRRNDLWLEIRDTELTRTIKTRFGLKLSSNRNLPDSTQKAAEYLEFILPEFEKTKLGKALETHLKQNTLVDFMVHKRLNQMVDETKSIPNSFLRWMLEVAVATCSEEPDSDAAFANLSRGAYQTLVELWSTGAGLAAKGCILAISDLPIQLKEWFGIDLSASPDVNPKSPTSVASLTTTTGDSSKIPKPMQALSIVRFLHLWQLALEQNMVYLDDTEQNKQGLSDSILALLLVSLDPFVFESTETLASYQPSAKLKQFLGYLMQIAKETNKNNPLWVTQLATKIVNLISSGSTCSDHQEETVWSDHGRVMRVLCHTQCSCELVANLCEQLFAKVLANEKSVSYWDPMIHKELGNLKGWSTFATISGVAFRLVERLPSQGATNVPAALVESLLEAVIMALGRLDIGVRGGANGLDTASKYAFFHLVDTVLVELAAKSKSLTAHNPDYLKVNYHASCFRQYSRLETQKYKITEHQSTLDGFFRKIK